MIRRTTALISCRLSPSAALSERDLSVAVNQRKQLKRIWVLTTAIPENASIVLDGVLKLPHLISSAVRKAEFRVSQRWDIKERERECFLYIYIYRYLWDYIYMCVYIINRHKISIDIPTFSDNWIRSEPSAFPRAWNTSDELTFPPSAALDRSVRLEATEKLHFVPNELLRSCLVFLEAHNCLLWPRFCLSSRA